MKFRTILSISIVAGFTALIISSLVLPSFVSVFRTTLNMLDLGDTINLIGWFGEILIFVSISAAIILLSRQYNFKIMLRCLLISFIVSVVLLSTSSYIYLVIVTPEIFSGLSLIDKLVNFLSYPNIIAVYQQTPQYIWIISTALQIALFNFKYYQVTEK